MRRVLAARLNFFGAKRGEPGQMKKAKENSKAVKGAKKPAKKKSAGRPVDLAVVRQKIANKVGEQAENMVKTTIGEVGKGHYPAMKFLFEMVGLYPSGANEEPVGENVLAKTLLRRLSLPEEEPVEHREEHPVEHPEESGREDTAEAAASDAVK
jgi:hypothetical protein